MRNHPLSTSIYRPNVQWGHIPVDLPIIGYGKRTFDLFFSVVVLLFFVSWMTPIIGLIIWLESRENPFFTQTRIGQNGQAFKLYKFRSMRGKPPGNDPLLSKDEQGRITRFGRFMRAYRIDEFPQFFNVLKGQMTVVGPRPERQVFLDKITEHIPQYAVLQKLPPGITSLGQIRYGYADTLEQMIKRARYDLIYPNNVSLSTDIKIILKTIIVVFQGKGR